MKINLKIEEVEEAEEQEIQFLKKKHLNDVKPQ